MIDLFTDLFDYHYHFNQEWLYEFDANMETLPPSTYALFCHMINAHQIWNARILGNDPLGVAEVHSIDRGRSLDRKNRQDSLEIIESHEMDMDIEYENSAGMPFTNTVRDILFHIINHSTHHKAQVASDFRKAGLKPLVTDYIFYRRSDLMS